MARVKVTAYVYTAMFTGISVMCLMIFQSTQYKLLLSRTIVVHVVYILEVKEELQHRGEAKTRKMLVVNGGIPARCRRSARLSGL